MLNTEEFVTKKKIWSIELDICLVTNKCLKLHVNNSLSNLHPLLKENVIHKVQKT